MFVFKIMAAECTTITTVQGGRNKIHAYKLPSAFTRKVFWFVSGMSKHTEFLSQLHRDYGKIHATRRPPANHSSQRARSLGYVILLKKKGPALSICSII